MFCYFHFDVMLLYFRGAVMLLSLEANVALPHRLRLNASAVLRVVLAWKSFVRVLCSSAVDEPSSSADALQHCLQNLVRVRLSVLCSSARAGVGDVVLCISFRVAEHSAVHGRVAEQTAALPLLERLLVGRLCVGPRGGGDRTKLGECLARRGGLLFGERLHGFDV